MVISFYYFIIGLYINDILRNFYILTVSIPVPKGSIFPFIFPYIEIYHHHTDHAEKFSAGRKYV